jgi:hypothetical protein
MGRLHWCRVGAFVQLHFGLVGSQVDHPRAEGYKAAPTGDERQNSITVQGLACQHGARDLQFLLAVDTRLKCPKAKSPFLPLRRLHIAPAAVNLRAHWCTLPGFVVRFCLPFSRSCWSELNASVFLDSRLLLPVCSLRAVLRLRDVLEVPYRATDPPVALGARIRKDHCRLRSCFAGLDARPF